MSVLWGSTAHCVKLSGEDLSRYSKKRAQQSLRWATMATIDMGQKLGVGGCAVFSGGSWVPIEHKVDWDETYLHTKWHLNASTRLATIKIGQKLGALPLLGSRVSI